MSNDTYLLSGDPQAMQREEAARTGASKFGGVLKIIGDLEYYSLIELRCGEPTNPKQITTPAWFYAVGKGASLGLYADGFALISYICVTLLAASFGWSESLKIIALSMLFSGVVYGTNCYLLGKLYFCDGAADKMKKAVMLGFTGHLVILKFLLCMLPWFLKEMQVDVGLLVYQNLAEIYPYYLQMILSPGVEWILFGSIISGTVLAVLRDRIIYAHWRDIQHSGRPYDLLTS